MQHYGTIGLHFLAREGSVEAVSPGGQREINGAARPRIMHLRIAGPLPHHRPGSKLTARRSSSSFGPSPRKTCSFLVGACDISTPPTFGTGKAKSYAWPSNSFLGASDWHFESPRCSNSLLFRARFCRKSIPTFRPALWKLISPRRRSSCKRPRRSIPTGTGSMTPACVFPYAKDR